MTGRKKWSELKHKGAPKEYRTESGRVLTDADIQALADEAEQGYEVTRLQAARAQQEKEYNRLYWRLVRFWDRLRGRS